MATEFKIVSPVWYSRKDADLDAEYLKGVVFRVKDIKPEYWTTLMMQHPDAYVVCRIDSV